MEDLLKALKFDQDVDDENDQEDENEKYPVHDPSTHWKLKKPMV